PPALPELDLLPRLRTGLAERYRVERELAHGRMATVFLARDVKHGRLVAIKVLHPELAAAVGTTRFLREIGFAAQLHHPHIVPLHDSGEQDGLPYFVMPYVEGESLRPPGARTAASSAGGAADRRRRSEGLGVRPYPRRGASRHQAGEHPAREWPCSGGGLRDRASDQRRRQRPAHRNGDRARHTRVHEP